MKQPMWEKFPGLVKAVRQDHEQAQALSGTGHDFAHALMVAQYAEIIGREISPLGWIAGICHNTDRLFPEKKSATELAEKIYKYLGATNLDVNSMALIFEAVLNHSKKPSPNDSPVAIILMDADKLANLGYNHALRAAQFRPNVPPIDLRYLDQEHPGATFKNPRSIYWDLKHCLEWEE